jgi:signal transduction histidine kinase
MITPNNTNPHKKYKPNANTFSETNNYREPLSPQISPYNAMQKIAQQHELNAQQKIDYLLKLALEQERRHTHFQDTVKKIDHDIRSPLMAISAVIHVSDELHDEKRAVLSKSVNGVFNILHGLSDSYKNDGDDRVSFAEPQQNLLVADIVAEVFDEKKYQYAQHAIDFELHITESAQSAYMDVQAIQLRRMVSNVINNAIDALKKDKPGIIDIHLDATESQVNIRIRDNGIGMSAESVQKIQNRVAFTKNKKNGHGLGMQQVWEALEYNSGKMTIESKVDQGTCVYLSFPRLKLAER